MQTIDQPALELWPLPLDRYERMVELGILGEDDKVELLRGVLAAMSPQGQPHIVTCRSSSGSTPRPGSPSTG